MIVESIKLTGLSEVDRSIIISIVNGGFFYALKELYERVLIHFFSNGEIKIPDYDKYGNWLPYEEDEVKDRVSD